MNRHKKAKAQLLAELDHSQKEIEAQVQQGGAQVQKGLQKLTQGRDQASIASKASIYGLGAAGLIAGLIGSFALLRSKKRDQTAQTESHPPAEREQDPSEPDEKSFTKQSEISKNLHRQTPPASRNTHKLTKPIAENILQPLWQHSKPVLSAWLQLQATQALNEFLKKTETAKAPPSSDTAKDD